jgi:protein SCO1/2
VWCAAGLLWAGHGVAAGAGPAFRLGVWPASAESPGFNLVDVNGRHRTGRDFRGQVVVIFFGFVRCPDACPAGLLKLSLAKKRLGPDGDRVRVLFITLDPEHDTRAGLRSYVEAFDPTFVALTGTTADVDRAAAGFHVRYARVPQGPDYTINHSVGTFIFDRKGRLRLVAASDSTVDDFAHDLAVLANE